MEVTVNIYELVLYFCVWIFSNIYSLHLLFVTQTDVEWSSWKYFIQSSWHYLILQFVVSEILRRTELIALKYWYITSSVIFIVLHMGLKQLLVICAQPIIFVSIIFCGGKKISIWLTGIVLLVSYNSLKYKYFFWYFLDHKELEDEEVYLILFTIAWIELRCISFCIDYIDKKEKINNHNQPTAVDTIVDMFSYILYLPLLYIGPMILYQDFEKSFCRPKEKLPLRLKNFISDMSLFLFYTFILDLAFHFIYFLAMQNDMETIRKLPTIALCGGGLWMGLEFHMKYVISYGTTTAFARLDNIDAPPTPRCIARVHVYSQMWRYFDVGLYRFLVKYIYKPSFTTLSKCFMLYESANKLIASFFTFVFIFMWHGTVWNIFVWSVLNFFGITMEHIGKGISGGVLYKWFKENVLKTNEMETRFIALLCTPLLALSAISNFYLFGGTQVGNLFFESLLNPSFWNTLLVCIALYSCCQVSMALKNIGSRTDKYNKRIEFNLEC
ncbi:protein-cysteine N-palmitoyltransferase Rasp isoform X2 [Achroia grisella]|uniref:protein-cysteine N-palmitoyltransferase Rasp isoform X2 n=1 Tax=Achroia grisella TaxID=688607 RepID=UPI0027D2D561|nr:protein-cysteine N-palmitoyltransferase Rasp isoform X2 [Achroia grisella]